MEAIQIREALIAAIRSRAQLGVMIIDNGLYREPSATIVRDLVNDPTNAYCIVGARERNLPDDAIILRHWAEQENFPKAPDNLVGSLNLPIAYYWPRR